MSSGDKLWTEDLGQLFSSSSIVPTSDMTLEAKMNALTRLALVSSLVMALFNLTLGIVMLFISIIVIVAVYSAKKEGYEDPVMFCNDAVPITPNDPTFVSLNQRLVGPANPKTLIPPFCAAPSHDLSVWKENNLVQHSAINAQTNFDLNRSGYSSSYSSMPSKCTTCHYVPCMCHVHKKFAAEDPAAYRDRLLTQTLQPGVYQKSYVGEPINTNLGITLTQPFAPTAVEETPESIKFIQYQPASYERVTTLASSSPPQQQPQTQDNVYDPRFTGYGTSYRGYTDDLTGQAKFFYKDVDTVIRPNYIVRSHVDIFPWADRYGPREEKKEECDIRTLANQSFHDSTLTFRTELQERQMRKRNAEMWQRRAFPKSTQPQHQ